MKEVTVQELNTAIEANEDILLIDVRETHEHALANIGGVHIPMAQVPLNVQQLRTDKKVILYCRSGARSGQLVHWLEKNHGLTNLYNLKGGLMAWRREIDDSLLVF
jgi:sulfur-carrier protein adenylyltransferase/sulfurtransferase